MYTRPTEQAHALHGHSATTAPPCPCPKVNSSAASVRTDVCCSPPDAPTTLFPANTSTSLGTGSLSSSPPWPAPQILHHQRLKALVPRSTSPCDYHLSLHRPPSSSLVPAPTSAQTRAVLRGPASHSHAHPQVSAPKGEELSCLGPCCRVTITRRYTNHLIPCQRHDLPRTQLFCMFSTSVANPCLCLRICTLSLHRKCTLASSFPDLTQDREQHQGRGELGRELEPGFEVLELALSVA
jgi:hypothetical protein